MFKSAKHFISQIFGKLFLLAFLIFNTVHLSIGQSDTIIIDSIIIEGNKKTHDHIITYEMVVKKGDTLLLVELSGVLSADEKRLQSIGIFTDAKVNIHNWYGNHAIIKVTVQENWYIYPYIIFELADRNFNVWRKEFNYSIRRTNYGLALTNINFTGNKDKLKLKFQRGYIHKYEASYERPYILNGWGLSANFLYSESKEIGYLSKENKLLFHKLKDESVIFSQFKGSVGLGRRYSAYLTYNLRLERILAKVSDSIATNLNSKFFLEGNNKLRFWNANANLLWNRTIYPLYPIGGYRLELIVRKDGFTTKDEINNLWFSLDAEHHLPIHKRLILSNRVKTKLYLLDKEIPYFQYSGLGYSNDVLSGYQLQVMDGKNFFLNKNSIKFNIYSFDYTPKYKMPKQYKIMNVKLFGGFNADLGYVYDPIYGDSNPLNNSFEYGFGPRLDLILFNNLTISCEYSWIRNGQHGFFIDSGFNF
jgi:outer membrane protein assembly factor BamA